MNPLLKKVVKRSLHKLDLALVRRKDLDSMLQAKARLEELQRVLRFPGGQISRLVDLLPASKAQLRQDLFVLGQLDFMRNGYFVEFGATDGETDSNTHLLEQQFGWTGILAEPARCWHSALRRNRSQCVIDTRCVWSASGKTLRFNEAEIAVLSTVDTYSDGDMHGKGRVQGTTYEVTTVSLQDLLDDHGAPKEIDYLSIDTEGSEFEILSHFDFDRYRFKVISCEHNWTPMREKLLALLSSKGYVRTLADVSWVDDWYIHRDLVAPEAEADEPFVSASP